MREIKFRAWHRDTKEMLYPDKQCHLFAWLEYDNQPINIMQYTGLKDKNGKEIYEGDIFNYKTDKGHPNGGRIAGTFGYHPENSCVVKFSDGAFWCDTELLVNYVNFSKLPGHGKEVIGNIYENPELLK